jgi:hypothetical protein
VAAADYDDVKRLLHGYLVRPFALGVSVFPGGSNSFAPRSLPNTRSIDCSGAASPTR